MRNLVNRWEIGAIATEFSESERRRFRSLLELAKGSQFEGESKNALEAAKRLAAKHGMSLDEAAQADQPTQAPVSPPRSGGNTSDNNWNDVFTRSRPRHAPDVFYNYEAVNVEAIREAKRQRDAAVRSAESRGLDGAERKAKEKAKKRSENRIYRTSNKSRGRNPETHADILLRETSLPFSEIAAITGLDFYAVVGLKLKQRQLT